MPDRDILSGSLAGRPSPEIPGASEARGSFEPAVKLINGPRLKFLRANFPFGCGMRSTYQSPFRRARPVA